MSYADMLLDAVPFESHTLIELNRQFDEICNNPLSSGDDLRKAAQIASRLSTHYSVAAIGLIDNAKEVDENAILDEFKICDNPYKDEKEE